MTDAAHAAIGDPLSAFYTKCIRCFQVAISRLPNALRICSQTLKDCQRVLFHMRYVTMTRNRRGSCSAGQSSWTVNHDVLLCWLETYFGVCGTALRWFRFFNSERSQAVSFGHSTSAYTPVGYIASRRGTFSNSGVLVHLLTSSHLLLNMAYVSTPTPMTHNDALAV